jgi:hypothetical protein
MSEQMLIYRLEDIAMNYWVREILEPFGIINIVDEFPVEIATVPTVSVVEGKIAEQEYELGNRDGVRVRRWFIDVFALNKQQRKDVGYKLLSEAKQGINVYDYNEGFPPDASPSFINHLSVINRTFEPLDIIQDLNPKLYYRGQLILITKNDLV